MWQVAFKNIHAVYTYVSNASFTLGSLAIFFLCFRNLKSLSRSCKNQWKRLSGPAVLPIFPRGHLDGLGGWLLDGLLPAWSQTRSPARGEPLALKLGADGTWLPLGLKGAMAHVGGCGPALFRPLQRLSQCVSSTHRNGNPRGPERSRAPHSLSRRLEKRHPAQVGTDPDAR